MPLASRSARRLAAVTSAGAVALTPFAALSGPAGATTGNRFQVTPIVSDLAGVAQTQDKSLVNAWGMSRGPTTPVWVSDNGTGVTTLYALGGSSPKVNLTVTVPGGGDPTGQVFNGDSTAFAIPGAGGPQPARFIFVTESGVLSAWNPSRPIAVNPTTGAATSVARRQFMLRTAVFKGLAIAGAGTATRLYAADFHNATVDMWDSAWHRLRVAGAFRDPSLPAGFAPFNVAAINGSIYVTYAKQDAARHDDVAGRGNGFIDVYNLNGRLEKRLISMGKLDSPWGMTIAPAGFGRFGGDLLVGNFGDGKIHAYDPGTGAFDGTLLDPFGNVLVIHGLWALMFGNGTSAPTSSLLFSAGPGHESHGLFGTITLR